MTDEKIKRINELYHKSKTEEGLTPAEKEEQAALRQEYLQDIRKSVRGMLNNIDIKEKDGSITHVADIPQKNKQ